MPGFGMKNQYIFAAVILFGALLNGGCQMSGLISERPVDPVIGVEPVIVHGPGVSGPQRQDLFARERRPVIAELPQDPDATGSLFSLEDSRSNLIVQNPLRVGMVLDVKVIVARSAAGDGNAKGKSSKGSGKQAGASGGADGLTEAVPKLEPVVSGTAPLNSFKMRLDSILPNGDGLVSVRRDSSRTGEFREMYARARVPAERMIPGAGLTTEDLFDVVLSDFDGTLSTERRSTGWEDEYSLRLSGFEELRSKEAVAVEEARRQVQSEKDKIAEESRKITEERARSAKQRDELQQKLRETEARIAEIQKGSAATGDAKTVAAASAAPSAVADANAAKAAKGGADEKKK